jgi:hypothetical protein
MYRLRLILLKIFDIIFIEKKKGVKEMEEKKMTKKDYYILIKEIVENTDAEEKNELIDFLNKQISQIEAKAEKAKIRATEKQKAGDELRDRVKSILTDELQTADAIVAQIDDEDVTKAKVIARLTQLVKNGDAEKDDVKTQDGRNVKAYKIKSE